MVNIIDNVITHGLLAIDAALAPNIDNSIALI
jgi:hypothetical protein